MTNTNKIIIVLVLVSLVTTVIGSWLIFEQLNNTETACSSCQNTAPVIIRNTDSSTVTLTIAPAGPRNIASGKVLLDIKG